VHVPLVVSWRGHDGDDAVEHDVIGRELTNLLDVFGPRHRVFDHEDPAGSVRAGIADAADVFSAAVTMYGLKDDMLAHSGGDLDALTDQLAKWRSQLAALVRGANCYRANVDMLDASARDAALEELGIGRP
jgi:hypothetical protein